MYVFFGAGKLGRRMLDFWRWCGLEPEYFVDNNPDLFDKRIEGIEVVPLQSVFQMKDVTYIITSRYSEQIIKQLQKSGVKDQYIIKAASEIMVLDYIMKQEKYSMPIEKLPFHTQNPKQKVLFDLANGLVLGGVETWSIQTAEMLQSIGYKTCLSIDISRPRVLTTDLEILSVDIQRGIVHCLNQIIQSGARCIVSNFPSYNFQAACILKKVYGQQIKLIAVVHNDETIYYEKYIAMQEYIDKCLVISERIQNELLEKGFPANKCEYLPWEIETSATLTRSYADKHQPIRIGYAGRLTIGQKRTDLLLDVVEKLEELNITYQLQIAGNGDYEKELHERIKKMKCEDRVKHRGLVSHDKIPKFWSEQDIMITCSEFEGHSISQCEAMAQGVVPIITDTSGARDDVVDGENGFVVPIGAINEIVEKICFLNENRELLEIMGRKAYETIKQNNNTSELRKLWKNLLK